jgi:hypothetical protein
MALDTAVKRLSAIHIGCPWRGMLPFPDASISQADRQHIAFLYRGVIAGDDEETVERPWANVIKVFASGVTNKHIRAVGDTLLPLNVLVCLDSQLNLNAYTVTFRIEDDAGTVIQSGASVSAHVTQEFTASATTGLATCNGHGLEEGQQVVVANSGGALPSGLSANTRYFAVNVTPNMFGLATTPGGISVIAGAGTGTHTFYIVGSFQYTFDAADVDAAGLFRGWAVLTSNSLTHHLPAGGHIPIEIQAVGN